MGRDRNVSFMVSVARDLANHGRSYATRVSIMLRALVKFALALTVVLSFGMHETAHAIAPAPKDEKQKKAEKNQTKPKPGSRFQAKANGKPGASAKPQGKDEKPKPAARMNATRKKPSRINPDGTRNAGAAAQAGSETGTRGADGAPGASDAEPAPGTEEADKYLAEANAPGGAKPAGAAAAAPAASGDSKAIPAASIKDSIPNLSADYDPKLGAVQLAGRFAKECVQHLSVKAEGQDGATAMFRVNDETGQGLACLARNKDLCANVDNPEKCTDFQQLSADAKAGGRFQTRYTFSGDKPENPYFGFTYNDTVQDGKTMSTLTSYKCTKPGSSGVDDAYRQGRDLRDINDRALGEDDRYRTRRSDRWSDSDEMDDYDRKRRRRYKSAADEIEDYDRHRNRRDRTNWSLEGVRAMNASLMFAPALLGQYFASQPGGVYGYGFNYGFPSLGIPGYGGYQYGAPLFGAGYGGYLGNYGTYQPSPVLGQYPMPWGYGYPQLGPVPAVAPVTPVTPTAPTGTRTR